MSYVDMSGDFGRNYVNSPATASYLSAECDYVAIDQRSSPVSVICEPLSIVSTVAIDANPIRGRRNLTREEIIENYEFLESLWHDILSSLDRLQRSNNYVIGFLILVVVLLFVSLVLILNKVIPI